MKRSLVLVTVDCLRADHVGFQGYSRPVTPFLDLLAKDSLVFSDAIAAGVPTYFSFPAIIASRYPLGLGRDVLGIAPNEPTVATALREAGYRTAAFLASNPYLSPRYGYHQGFEVFRDYLGSAPRDESALPTRDQNNRLSSFNRRLQLASRRTRLTEAAYNEVYFWYCQWRAARETVSIDKLRPYPPADVMVDQSCSWLRSFGDEPFFLWIHLMDPHHPHYPPQEALASLEIPDISIRHARFLNSFWNRRDIGARRLSRYRDEILSLYDASIYWVDKQLSRLVQTLQQLQRWDKTVLVVTADHGEEFLEHGARYHSPLNLPEQLIHVPLLVRAPEVAPARFSAVPFSLIHLAPTLLEGMGVAVPAGFQGRSYWKQISAGTLSTEPAIAETVEAGENPTQVEDRLRFRLIVVRDRAYKLVLRFSEKKDELYDLKNDPEERKPLADGSLTGERARLLHAAREHLQRSHRYRNADLALRARLREIRQSVASRNG